MNDQQEIHIILITKVTDAPEDASFITIIIKMKKTCWTLATSLTTHHTCSSRGGILENLIHELIESQLFEI